VPSRRPDGKGFPRGLDAHRITQLCAVFNIARTFVNLLFKHDFNEAKMPGILSYFIKNYNVGNYKQPLKAMIECFPFAANQISSDLD
jgi:response regulator RpfG family c-di-GMP phosphodiesterase